jgi:hypothetical protein
VSVLLICRFVLCGKLQFQRSVIQIFIICL